MTDPNISEQEEKLRKVHQGAGDAAAAVLKAVSPEFMQFTVELVSSIYSRPQLDVRTREVISLTIFTMLGFTTTGLEIHLNNALNVGLTKEEIIEIIMQISVFAGVATGTNALLTAKKVFDSRGL